MMPDRPLPSITIITPSYNQGQFIERTLLSIWRQNYPNLEHLVIDGGSTDQTIEILKRFPQIKWVSEPDRGQSDALNKGYASATGEIIGWLNSDDLYVPETLETVGRLFAESPDVDVIYGDCYYIDENDRILRKFRSADFDLDRLLSGGHCYIHQMAAFIRKRAWDKLEIPLDPDLHFCMDHDLFVRLALAGCTFRHIPRFLACFRRTAGTKTTLNIGKMRRESYLLGRKYGNRSLQLRINYLLSQIYVSVPFLAKALRPIRYRSSFFASHRSFSDPQILPYTGYSEEPAGLRRLSFFIDGVRNYQVAGAYRPDEVSVLDLGCGNGNITFALGALGFHTLGIDADPLTVENARKKNALPNVSFENVGIEELGQDRKFDVIVASEVIEHFDRPEQVLPIIRNLLKPGGRLLVSIPNGFCLEELLRRVSTHTSMGRGIKTFIKSHIMRKQTVQSLSDSPHVQFFSLAAFGRLLHKTGFDIVSTRNMSIFFKEAFYIFLRLTVKRGSRTFHTLNALDDKISELLPVMFCNGWMFEIRRTEPKR